MLALGPASVHTSAGQVRVGDGWVTTLIVTGYPSEVGMAWLEPVLTWPGHLDVAIHIDPIPTDQAISRVRRQRARLESVRRIDAGRGRLDDPLIEASAADAADLGDLIVRGQSRLFSVGIYLSVHARTRADLLEAVAQVRAAAASVLLEVHPATWRQRQGWLSTLPLGHDGLGMRRVMDTDALAASFPLGSPDLPAALPGEEESTGGVLYGVNPYSGAVLCWDRWSCDNHNSVVLAHSGAGKSYLMKVEVLRHLYDGVQVAVIDPEDEYVPLAQAVGGTLIQLGAPGVRLNPLDLPAGDRRPDALTRRILFAHTLIAVLLAQPLSAPERAALDRALRATYASAGITPDPATWTRPAPQLRHLAGVLDQHATTGPLPVAGTGAGDEDEGAGGPTGPDPVAGVLAARLDPWVNGSFKDLFDGPSTLTPAGHLIVWSTRHLPDEVRAGGMLLALDAIWRDIDTPAARPPWGSARHRGARVPRRLVVVDEAWALMREPEGAQFLARMAKSARKRRAGLAVLTQDTADLLASDLGQVVIANAATQILMHQAPQAIDAVAATFHLSPGEARLLRSAERGVALLLSGTHRVPFVSIASDAEHTLATGWADQPDPDPEEDPDWDETEPPTAQYTYPRVTPGDDDDFWR